MEQNLEEMSLAEALGAAFDEAESAEEPAPEPETETEQVEAEPADEPAIEAVDEGAESEEDEVESEAPIDAPVSLSEEEKAIYAEMPPEMQAYVQRREAERDAAFKSKTAEISGITSAFEPYKEMLAMNGITEAQAIERLLNAQAYLQRDPLNAIKMLAHSYGVADQLAPPQPTSSVEDDYVDPQVKALQDQVQQLQSQLNQSVQQTQQQSQQALLQEVANFKAATDEQGNLLHPHFDSVRDLMAVKVQQGMGLEDAYKAVVATVPEVREAEIARIKEEAAKARATEVKRKARQAKKAATHVARGKSDAEPEVPEDLHGALEAAWDEVTGGN
jgi:hypothetical protein